MQPGRKYEEEPVKGMPIATSSERWQKGQKVEQDIFFKRFLRT